MGQGGSFTIMADELQALGQRVEQLGIYQSGYADGIEGAVGGDDAVQGAALAFGDEVSSVGRLGFYHICDLGDGIPFAMSTGEKYGSDQSGRETIFG